jgi:formylglycine-generating enzyme required for sulfatase activity
MVWVTRSDDSRFCIDRFEAAVGSGALGNPHQGTDDEDPSLDGSTTAAAATSLGVAPTTGISWYQARAACENAGKRLCTLAEWERACRGTDSLIYPYGDTMIEDACNGFFAYTGQTPAVTGSLDTCGSAWGAYDLSGNVEEWVFDAWPRLPGSPLFDDRAVRGGSFKSNSQALQCVGEEFHEPPGSSDVDRGFRCCADGPV